MRTKQLQIPVQTARNKRSIQIKSIKPRWTTNDDIALLDSINNSPNLISGYKHYSYKSGRTIKSCEQRYKRLKAKQDLVKNLSISRALIPESDTNTFLEEVNVKMYRATIAGTNHEKAQDAVKANIRHILDSYDNVRNSENADDKLCHEWFYEFKELVEYMLNTDPQELWTN